MHRILRRGALLAFVGAASVLLSTVTVAPAHAAGPSRADRSASWLVDQLTAGLVHDDQYGYDDYGLTLDVAFGLQAIGVQPTALADIDTALESNVASYTGFGSEVYAGPTAKLLVFAQTRGDDATAYGGYNLVQRLNRRVSTTAPIRGRIVDRSQYGDYANTLGQAYAAHALKNAGSFKADRAVHFLLKQQCSEGYFRLNFAKKKARRDQTCDGGNPRTTSAPDTDATAVAVLQLKASKGKNRATRRAIRKAVRWLEQHQRRNGAFGGGTSTEGVNTNSTGLAGWALGAHGACGEARAAARWVAKWQVAPDGPTKLRTDVGAIAYDRAGWSAGRKQGITDGTRDQWRRASAQAAPALGNLRLAACRAG
jgi:hypothetical protein